MKYIITLLLSLIVFTACTSDPKTDETPAPTTTTQDSEETENTETSDSSEATESTESTDQSEATETTEETTSSDQLELTLEELATYNGKDGQPAYVAVDGVIYDVTESAAWKNGKHNGFEAGKDLTVEIKNQSPHGVSKLEGVTAIGVIVE